MQIFLYPFSLEKDLLLKSINSQQEEKKMYLFLCNLHCPVLLDSSTEVPTPAEADGAAGRSPPTSMAGGLLSKASSAVAACARRVSRATRRLLRARLLRRGGGGGGGETGKPDGGGGGGGEGLWRRAILMGERCEPLSFPGAIHYDSRGRRLSQPRRAKAKPAAATAALLCRSSDAVDEAVAAANNSKAARYVAVSLLRD